MYTEYVFEEKKYEVALRDIKAILFDIVSTEEAKINELRTKAFSNEQLYVQAELQELFVRQDDYLRVILSISNRLADALKKVDSCSRELKQLEDENTAQIIANVHEGVPQEQVQAVVDDHFSQTKSSPVHNTVVVENVPATEPVVEEAPPAIANEYVDANVTHIEDVPVDVPEDYVPPADYVNEVDTPAETQPVEEKKEEPVMAAASTEDLPPIDPPAEDASPTETKEEAPAVEEKTEEAAPIVETAEPASGETTTTESSNEEEAVMAYDDSLSTVGDALADTNTEGNTLTEVVSTESSNNEATTTETNGEVIPIESTSTEVIPTDSANDGLLPLDVPGGEVIPTESTSNEVIPTGDGLLPLDIPGGEVISTESTSNEVIPTGGGLFQDEPVSNEVIPTTSETSGPILTPIEEESSGVDLFAETSEPVIIPTIIGASEDETPVIEESSDVLPPIISTEEATPTEEVAPTPVFDTEGVSEILHFKKRMMNEEPKVIMISAKQAANLRRSMSTQEALLSAKGIFGSKKTDDSLEKDLMKNGLLESDVSMKQAKIEEMMQQANQLYADGKVEEAQDMFNQISALNKELQGESAGIVK